MEYIPLLIIIATSASILFLNAKNSNKRKKRTKDADYAAGEDDSQVDYGRLVRMFEILSKFPLTSKGTNQLHELIASLGVYTIVEQRVETARLLLTSYIVLLTSLVVVYYLTDDMIFRMGAIIIAFIFRRDFVNKKIRKERLAVREDLYRSFASLKNEWERVFSLQKAFNKTVVEDRNKLLFGSVTALFKTTSPSADLAYFNQNNNDTILQRFADLCYNTHYYGVEISPVSGVDTFISNLDIIMRDLQVEIDLAKEEKKKFYIAEKLPLAALGIVALAPGFLTSRYPGLYYFYNSAFGYMSMIIALIVITFGYNFVANINDDDRPLDDTFDFELKWFMRPKFKDFWERRVPSFNQSARDLLRDSLSYLTEEQLHFRKTYVSLLCGLVAFALTVAFVVFSQKSAIVDLSQLPEETMEIVKDRYQSPNEFAEKFVLDPNITTKEDMKAALGQESLNANETSMEVITNIMFENREKYLAAKYKPAYLFVVLAALLIGFYIPNIMLNRRKKMVDRTIDFEVLTLYAITVQMMYLPLKLRDYLKRFTYLSTLFPKTHLDCWVNQFNNPQFIKGAAMVMSNPHYYDLMERLYTLHSARTPPEVFREIERKREYMFIQLTKKREHIQNVRYKILTMVVFGVLLAVITAQVIIPIAVFSMQAFEQYSGFM